jgi:Ca2+-transporting ATPase
LTEVTQPKTPLQMAMKALAGKLVWVAAFFAVLIPAIGLLQGQEYRQMILTGLSLAFATIPEELPIIITMVLGLGSYALSRKHFLVKRIRAAETLGDVSVIVTDKTGTITESRMRVAGVYPDMRSACVLETALANVSAQVIEPLERALIDEAESRGLPQASSQVLQTRLVGNGRKTKATLRRHGENLRLFVSGAPEEVLSHALDTPDAYEETIRQETAKGRRVIAVASRPLRPGEDTRDLDQLEHDLEIAGLVSFEDPPRTGVKETIAQAAAAGIRTVMVTGDHPATAASIASQVGIPAGHVVTGSELDRLSDEALQSAVQKACVFARTSPEHKHRIVAALQRAGEVVAVTGDGVNDALALKAADVGIAMGIKGTDVAKEAAQVVLADDNYVTITRGVFEGRKFYDNLHKGVTYYLSVKLGLILIFLLPVLFGLPMPFSPIQIIVLELFMDLAASAGFVAEPAERAILARRPQRRGAMTLLDTPTAMAIIIKGVLLLAAVMAGYATAWTQGASAAQLQTAAFTAWMVGHVVLAYVSRSASEPVLTAGAFGNHVMNVWALAALGFLMVAIYVPWVQDGFQLAPISLARLTLVALLAAAITGLAEVAKRWAPGTPARPSQANPSIISDTDIGI